jgi:hypothetical protein
VSYPIQAIFFDGPAAGVSLIFGRSPVLLRVVRSPAGLWDVLDQLDDEARADEAIYVYQLLGRPLLAHVDYVENGRRRGETYYAVTYRAFGETIADEHLRTTAAWAAFCEANKQRILKQGAERGRA